MKKLFLFTLLSVLLISCNTGTSAEELASTIVAVTATAASPTPEPTDTTTPEPTATFTSSPEPTATQVDTPEPTATRTPVPTATPGPFVLKDDFSSRNLNWLICEICDWQDGALFYGPFESEDFGQHIILCRDCGESTHYRISVDATWVGGQSDRGYGLLLSASEDQMYVLEITPWKTVGLWKVDFLLGRWVEVKWGIYAAVRTENNPNRIEVDVVPTGNNGRVNIHVSVNGQNLFVAFNQEMGPGYIGLTMFGHAIEVSFDNFEFESEDKPVPLPADAGQSG